MIRVLVIGFGSIGKRHLRNMRTLLPEAEIAVWRQHSASKGSDCPEGANRIFFSEEEATAFAPTLVVVSSPAHRHVDTAIKFADSGCHVFIEKPLGMSSDEVERLEASVARSTGFVMVGYVLRFLPALYRIRELLAAGKLGKVHTAFIQVGQYLPDWRPSTDYRDGVSAQAQLGGGALMELSHEIDYCVWLFGRPSRLWCSARQVSSLEIDCEDLATLVFDYDEPGQEKTIIIRLDFLQRQARMECQVVCENGTILADLLNETVEVTSGDAELRIPAENFAYEHGNQLYLDQFDYFIRSSLDDYPSMKAELLAQREHATVSDGAYIIQLIEEARSSNREGKSVLVNATRVPK